MKNILFITFFINFFISFSQIVVIDSISRKELSFVNFKVKNKSIGSYSNNKGEIFLPKKISNTDTLVISNIGYNTKTITYNNYLNKDSIFLSPKINQLNEIQILQTKKSYKELGFFKKKQNKTWFLNSGMEFCVYINNSYGKVNIHTIKIPIRNNKQTKLNSIFRIHIYDVTNQKQIGKELLENNVIIKVDNSLKKEIIIDMSDQDIQISKRGVFIGIEAIGILNQNNVLETSFKINPGIKFTSKVNEKYTYFRGVFNENDWLLFDQNIFSSNKKNKILNIAIGIVVEIVK